MLSESPCVFIEHHSLYGRKGTIPEGKADHVVQPCKARIVRAGTDVTVVSYGWGVEACLSAATALANEKIESEVIDLRTLDDRGMDLACVGRSLRRTGMLVVVEEAPSSTSLGAKIVSRCQADYFDCFDGPALRVTSMDVPVPVSRYLEQACLPAPDSIMDTIRRAAGRRG